MIELFEQDCKTIDRQSSKGNQLKWENNGIWYKADYCGYEGLSEYVISNLLKKSTLKSNQFVLYDLEQIMYKTVCYNGAKSNNFLHDDWQIITLERLYKTFTGKSLYIETWHIPDTEERLLFLVDQIERITGLKEFGKYMNILFTIDALFLNEDRHMHNIALIVNDDSTYEYCPIFDNGASLLSDIKIDYPLNNNVIDMIKTVKSKTLGPDFIEAINQIEELYGTKINFYFTDNDINEVTDNCSIYNEDIRKRIKQILKYQRNKMEYYF